MTLFYFRSVIEAIEVNFGGALDDLKVGKNDLDRCMHVQKEQNVTDD